MSLKMMSKTSNKNTEENMFNELWTAPELLRREKTIDRGSKEGDIYSYGIIVQEILLEGGPYCENVPTLDSAEIVEKVKLGKAPLYRPSVDKCMCRTFTLEVIKQSIYGS